MLIKKFIFIFMLTFSQTLTIAKQIDLSYLNIT